MPLQKIIKVLVVDDSMFFREVIARGLSSVPNIEVVATAVDPFDARDKILEYKPDVMTCDVEMPRMNGIEFLKRLLPQYPIPVIVVSSVSDSVFEAMKAGAVDFVTKPNLNSAVTIEKFLYELIDKVKIASIAHLRTIREDMIQHKINDNIKTDSDKIIALIVKKQRLVTMLNRERY
ncbi:MAG: cheB5 [Clostridiales bacterium]|nr:cheB5 [Clostridiales bacterium]